MTINKNKVAQLRAKIYEFDRAYYDEGIYLVSDEKYDEICYELKELTLEKYDHVGYPISRDPKKHDNVMLSLNNISTDAELSKFNDAVCNKINKQAVSFIYELKIKGVSLSLIYEKGKLISALTISDGEVRQDILREVRNISGIPIFIKYNKRINISGKVYTTHKKFIAINNKRNKDGLKLHKTPEKLVASAIMNKTVTELKHCSFYAYNCIGSLFPKYDLCMNWLCTQGFDRLFWHICEGISGSIINKLQQHAKTIPIDGVVIKLNDYGERDILGSYNISPEWAIAYKFSDISVNTIVTGIELSISQFGTITPIVQVSPVLVGGDIIRRVTLHNYNILEKLNLCVGDNVYVKCSGGVVPYITNAVRTANSIPIEAPNICPVCSSGIKFTMNKQTKVKIIYCPNKECDAQLKRKLELYCIRMGMSYIRTAIINKLFNAGLVRYPHNFYTVTVKELLKLPHIKIIRARKIFTVIFNSKNISGIGINYLTKFLHALCIPCVGIKHANYIAEKLVISNFSISKFINIFKLHNQDYKLYKELHEIKNISPLVKFFNDEINVIRTNILWKHLYNYDN